MPTERAHLERLVGQINASSIPFVQGIEYGAPQQRRVDEVAALIGEAFRYASDLDLPMRLQVIGRTDGTGSVERNLTVGSQRAQLIADALLRSAQPMPPLDLRAVTQPPSLDDVLSAILSMLAPTRSPAASSFFTLASSGWDLTGSASPDSAVAPSETASSAHHAFGAII